MLDVHRIGHDMKTAKLVIQEPPGAEAPAAPGAAHTNGAMSHSSNDKPGEEAGKNYGKVNSKVNILLVDDRADKLLALSAILTPLGQNLIEAKSGKEALRL